MIIGGVRGYYVRAIDENKILIYYHISPLEGSRFGAFQAMNEAHTRYLFKNFSFFKPNQPATETSMCFGFECGDGWFELIKNLCEKLKSLNIPDLRVLQVKEKFGGLRFYAGAIENDKADEAFKLIDKAEDDSVNICEKCGKPGTLQTTRSWLKTLCEKCSA